VRVDTAHCTLPLSMLYEHMTPNAPSFTTISQAGKKLLLRSYGDTLAYGERGGGG
jgi:hypothetical protein